MAKGANKKLAAEAQEISLSRLRNVERLKQLAESSGAPINFYVKFILMERDETFSYQVSESEWKEVSEFFQYRENPMPGFITFTDIEHGIIVHVNPDYVLLHQALYDAGRLEKTQRPGEEVNRLTIYMLGRAKPLEFDFMDDTDIGDLNESLLCFDRESMEFVNFIDGDGEENSIRVDSILVVESPDYPREVEDDQVLLKESAD